MPAEWVADGLSGLPATDVDIVALGRDMGQADEHTDFAAVSLPPSAAAVEFFVPSFFPSAANVAALRQMPRLRVVQTLTAGVEWLRPHLPPGVALGNARGAHDASTAEWVVGAMLGALRGFPGLAREQAAGHWSYQATDQLATKTVLIVG